MKSFRRRAFPKSNNSRQLIGVDEHRHKKVLRLDFENVFDSIYYDFNLKTLKIYYIKAYNGYKES